ncbi:Tn3 family transposase [Streptomyces sp. NPDC005706]|uniref:Tn3 family transposase n=1 Tax=Streptomyces sp. NPDC005706 TaxID=3157169 RepID=UPI0033C00B37
MARYLRLRDLQREIEEGLNVMESSNGANSVIAYGKGGEIASNRRDDQEMFVCLRILQSVLVYVNTLMLQDILGEPEWADLLTDADRRGLTPLFWPRTPVRRGESRHGGPSEPHRNYGAGRPGTDQRCWLGCGGKTMTDRYRLSLLESHAVEDSLEDVVAVG